MGYLRPATDVDLDNLTLVTVNTEYSQALSADCKSFEIFSRTAAIRMGVETGTVANTASDDACYRTIAVNTTYTQENVMLPGSTLYFASGTANAIVEIIHWS